MKNVKSLAIVALMSAASFASTITASDEFYEFYQKIDTWSQGGLAIGLALASLVIGGGMGVAKASPMPALAGVGLAAFFGFGPDVIQSLVNGGAVIA
ncbi:hypothetical protein [Alteromonas macleodii]|uniref:hypothetical protein n=1 Tax=Alteromonas macleodii TaxID=28108 RepID=UPI0031406318